MYGAVKCFAKFLKEAKREFFCGIRLLLFGRIFYNNLTVAYFCGNLTT